ncbi:MAG: hypothetical protein ACU837_13935 [Gammaproteobacteria bacterium]
MTTPTLLSSSCLRYGTAFAALALSAAAAFPAQAEISLCTEITSIPTTLTVQGTYCLKQNLETNITTGAAITIANNNITIDFNGFKVGGGQGGLGTQAVGIYALDRKNIVLRNGVIRGFYYGVFFDDSDADYSNTGGYRLYDLALDINRYVGVWLEGNGSAINNVRINTTGGSTVVPHAWALVNAGANADIGDNFIAATAADVSGLALGIFAVGSTVNIHGNQVTNTTFGAGGQGIGIFAPSPGDLIESNVVLNSALVASTGGIVSGSATQDLCVNNRISNFATVIQNCKDGGGNQTF